MTAQAEQPQSAFAIQRVYVKDLSFEAPNTPQVFLDEWKPMVDIEIQNRSVQLNDETHEIILRVMLSAKIGEKVAFIAEVQQAGIFTITGMTAEQLGPIVGSYCPNILFPYAREAIASLITRGGFPTVNLAPVNFDAAYQQHLQQMQQKTAENPVTEETTQH